MLKESLFKYGRQNVITIRDLRHGIIRSPHLLIPDSLELKAVNSHKGVFRYPLAKSNGFRVIIDHNFTGKCYFSFFASLFRRYPFRNLPGPLPDAEISW